MDGRSTSLSIIISSLSSPLSQNAMISTYFCPGLICPFITSFHTSTMLLFSLSLNLGYNSHLPSFHTFGSNTSYKRVVTQYTEFKKAW